MFTFNKQYKRDIFLFFLSKHNSDIMIHIVMMMKSYTMFFVHMKGFRVQYYIIRNIHNLTHSHTYSNYKQHIPWHFNLQHISLP